MSDFLKPTVIVSTALGLLQRELALPRLVWRDAFGNFAGAYNDTISVRLPAYAPARTRVLRAGTARTKDSLHERKVDVSLTTDIYKDVGITDEELTLDIRDFGGQVLNPMMVGVVDAIGTQLATAIGGATYENAIAFTASTDDAWKDMILPAREYLNNARVPMGGRVLACGSAAENALLGTDLFVKANESGGSTTLEEATLGRKGGFTVVSAPELPANKAYAFHQTGYALVGRAPVVPAGAPYGASQSFGGFALRLVRVFDPDAVEDRIVLDSWMGAKVVTDEGHFDADPDAGGKFVPVEDPDNPITGQANAWENDLARVVRAVEITVS